MTTRWSAAAQRDDRNEEARGRIGVPCALVGLVALMGSPALAEPAFPVKSLLIEGISTTQTIESGLGSQPSKSVDTYSAPAYFVPGPNGALGGAVTDTDCALPGAPPEIFSSGASDSKSRLDHLTYSPKGELKATFTCRTEEAQGQKTVATKTTVKGNVYQLTGTSKLALRGGAIDWDYELTEDLRVEMTATACKVLSYKMVSRSRAAPAGRPTGPSSTLSTAVTSSGPNTTCTINPPV
jgi:hypothetical protein